jgi:hypothetical protein
MTSTVNRVKLKRRLNFRKSILIKVGPSMTKTAPKSAGRTPVRQLTSVHFPDLCQSTYRCKVFLSHMRRYRPTNSPPTLHRAPLTLPGFKNRGKNNSLEENEDCLEYPGNLKRYVLKEPVGRHLPNCNRTPALTAAARARPGPPGPGPSELALGGTYREDRRTGVASSIRLTETVRVHSVRHGMLTTHGSYFRPVKKRF